MTAKRNEASILELILFVFSMTFAPQYFLIDLRLLIYISWIIYISMKARFEIRIKLTFYTKYTFLTLLFLSSYSMIVVLMTETYNHLVYIRYFRSILALIVIVTFISVRKVNVEKVIKALLFILLVHSLIIISEIIIPDIKSYMVFFSGESRRFYPYRANGLVNSYDLAGIYTIMGFQLSSLKYLQFKEKRYFLMSVICMISTLFTSRLNSILLIISIIYIFVKSFKQNVFVYKVFLGLILMLLGLSTVGIWAITTDTLPFIREYIFSKNWSNDLYWTIRATYSDDSLYQIIGEHFSLNINSVINLLFGYGHEGRFDPGYSKILNSIGLVGLLSILSYYIYQYTTLLKTRLMIENNSKNILFVAVQIMFIVIFFGNLKILYFFSTSIFELSSILILIIEHDNFSINHEKIVEE